MGDRQGRLSAVNLCPFVGVVLNLSVRRCGPQSVTDRPYSRYRADTDVNQSFNHLIMVNSCSRWHTPESCSIRVGILVFHHIFGAKISKVKYKKNGVVEGCFRQY